MTATTNPAPHSSEHISAALDTIAAGIEKMSAGLSTLRQLLSPTSTLPAAIDPKDPANKYEIGGIEKLTLRGVEVCYRLFDQGVSRYGVSQAMGISFGAANHRYSAWVKAGGLNRKKQALE